MLREQESISNEEVRRSFHDLFVGISNKDPRGCFELAKVLMSCVPGEPELQKAVLFAEVAMGLAQIAANASYPEAQGLFLECQNTLFQLLRYYTAHQPEESIRLYKRLAQCGHVGAQTQLILLADYFSRDGATQDLEKAASLYRFAANNHAQDDNLTREYLQTAMDLYKRAYTAGRDPEKCYRVRADFLECQDALCDLAKRYAAAKNIKESMRIYTMLANQEHHLESKLRLALCYQHGINGYYIKFDEADRLGKEIIGFCQRQLARDETQLIDRKKQHADAQFYLGQCYEHGIGIEEDLQAAMQCYKQAGTNHKRARYALNNLSMPSRTPNVTECETVTPYSQFFTRSNRMVVKKEETNPVAKPYEFNKSHNDPHHKKTHVDQKKHDNYKKRRM